MQNKFKVASLFCGCGGSDLGMVGGFNYLDKRYEELPFDIVYAVDFDKWAVDTYNKNFKHKAVCADVTEVDFTKIPDVDIMIGGFPCQSFSTVNPTKDTEDDRAQLYKQIVRFLKTKKPKYFICENVKGLITLKGGSIVKKIIGEFTECGYRVQYKLLKAVEYGIPQRRERVIIVGVRNDIIYNYEYPTPLYTEESATPLSAVIDNLVIEEQKYYFSQRAVQGVKNAKNNMKRGLWQDLNKPCLTITAHLAKTSMNSRDPILLVNPEAELYRRFTPREAARIQSFPDEFLLNDSEPKSYKQIGNAIPPVFMWYVAKQLEKAIIAKGTLSADDVKDYIPKNPEGYFSPANQKQKYIQLSFFDMLDQLESTASESCMAHEDLPIYNHYHATLYSTEIHKKLYIARGNVFDYSAFSADGIAAFVPVGNNKLSVSFDELKNHANPSVIIAEYCYNTTGTKKITSKNVNSIMTRVLDSLVKKGSRTIVIPRINIVDVETPKNDLLTKMAIVGWLEKNHEKINRIIIVVQ